MDQLTLVEVCKDIPSSIFSRFTHYVLYFRWDPDSSLMPFDDSFFVVPHGRNVMGGRKKGLRLWTSIFQSIKVMGRLVDRCPSLR